MKPTIGKIISSRANSFPGFVVVIDADVSFMVGQQVRICGVDDEPAQPVEAVDEDTREYVLRAMAMNYTDLHAWDHLDADACRRGADEIKALRAALAHPRPTGDVLGFDRTIETPRRKQAVEKLLELGWTYHHESGWTAPTVEQAGEVVRDRHMGVLQQYLIHLNSQNPTQGTRPRMSDVRAALKAVLAQPRPVGVPDGLIAAARGLLADYEEDHGEGACDCMPEPENAGHCCNACLVRAFTACAICEGRGGWFFAHSSHDQEWVECTECPPAPAKAGGA